MTPGDKIADALQAIDEGSRASDQESSTLDFKTVGRSRDDAMASFAEAASCFANAQGGVIVVGVRDGGSGRGAYEEVRLDTDTVLRRIWELTDPPLVVEVSERRHQGTRLLVITVPRSPDVHQVKGKATERIGAACEPMSARRIAAVLADRRGDDWSAVDSGVPASAVDDRSMAEARRLLRRAPDEERQSWADLSDKDLLRRLGLVCPSGTLTNAGVMLFVADEHRNLISYIHRRTRSGELTANQWLSAPGLTALLRCLELIEPRTDRTPINLPSGQQLFIADLPDRAVRESLVNAVIHRDYQETGHIQVEHASTRLCVTSPGDFVPGVNAGNILTVTSRPRNSLLASVIRSLTLAEAAGVGVDRMYAEMVKVGHQPPVFDSDGYRVSVTLNGGAPNAAVTRFVATLPDELSTDPDTLLVMLALLGRKTVTAEQLAPALQKESTEVEAVLGRLSSAPAELVERTRQTVRAKVGTYRLQAHAIAALGPAVSYRPRVDESTDRKVVEIVREVGQINGRMVRTVLDVDTPTASRILGDLVERQILVKTSLAQRGPSVTYGKGPKFPSRTSRGGARRQRRGTTHD